MGTVYLAERADGQFRKQVALKLIRRGLDTDDILSRFRYERQILAALDHPNIATLYDGGMTEDGRPYFAMEYVEGQPLTAYCDQHRLSTKQRLALFRTVCRAVQYAHQNLVIHRDLKPSNILVTDDGTVKLLDFGIAKLLTDEGLEETAPVTRTGLRLMTPEYAAPEQVKGEAVTTATDVYQLGVLLYELLTGHRPYRLERRVQREIERVILEEEPTRPSTMVGQTAETAEVISRARQTSVEKLRRQLSGDLDTIVLMALKKEPSRRYGTVQQLAEDLRRHGMGLPVVAHDDAMLYRMKKFVQRHKGGVLASALVVLALMAGLASTMWQASVAQAERDRAQAEAEKATQVADFLERIFEVSDPILAEGGTITAQELLHRGAARIEVELAEQPEVQAKMRRVIGSVYNSLGLYVEAIDLIERALEQQRTLFKGNHPDIAETLYALALAVFSKGDMGAASQRFREALAMGKRLYGDTHPMVARSQAALGWHVAVGQDSFNVGEQHLRAALATQRTLLDQHADVVQTLYWLGEVLHFKEKYRETEQHYQEGLERSRALYGEEHFRVAEGSNNLGALHFDEGNYFKAEPFFRQALFINRKALGDDHGALVVALNNLANALYSTGRFAEAEALLTESLALGRKHDNQGAVSYTLNHWGRLMLARSDYDQAEALFRQTLNNYLEHAPDYHYQVTRAHLRLGNALREQKRYAEADTHFQNARAGYEQIFDYESTYIAQVLHGQALLSYRRGDAIRAETTFREVLRIYTQTLPAEHPFEAEAKSGLGACLAAQGQYTEAEPLLKEGYTLLVEKRSPRHANTRRALEHLIALYDAWGKPDEAARYQAVLDAATASSD